MKIINIRFKDKIQYTKKRNFSDEELLKGNYQLIDRNQYGDYVCLLNGKHPIVIDARDIEEIERYVTTSEEIDYLMDVENIETKEPDVTCHNCDNCPHLTTKLNYRHCLYLKDMGFVVPTIFRCKFVGELEIDIPNKNIIRPDSCPLIKDIKKFWVLYLFTDFMNMGSIYIYGPHNYTTELKNAKRFVSEQDALDYKNKHKWMEFYNPLFLEE